MPGDASSAESVVSVMETDTDPPASREAELVGESAAPLESSLEQDGTTHQRRASTTTPSVSRREWLKTGLYVTGVCALAADIGFHHKTKPDNSNHPIPLLNTLPLPPLISTKPKTTTTTNGSLQPIDFAKVVQETRINITLSKEETHSCICLDHVTFPKKQYVDLPRWIPVWLAPTQKPTTLRDVSNPELWVAAVVAGTVVENGTHDLAVSSGDPQNTRPDRHE